jgi:hypothetical protein
MPRFIRERRANRTQRNAVEDVLRSATGKTALLRTDDGSVFVYDEHREWQPPTTLRVRITTSGDVEPPERLTLRVA